eukprot:Nitzschia sp. Nitz4//scaffold55_size114948//91737//92576//NITZ4_003920-RA/size114948-processed-gene-0.81-mRNA-1//-1//CDS//3329554587//79//frame0
MQHPESTGINLHLSISGGDSSVMTDNNAVTYGAIKSTDNKESPTARMEHLGAHRQYWRDIILGVNDGLISTFLLVAGVAGSGLSPTDILLTAIAGALAGAVSMSAGEFVATKSQNEVLQGEIGLERQHIRDNMKDEISEVKELLETIGIPPEKEDLRNHLLIHYENDPDALLKLMIALEFGVVEEEERSPIWAAVTSGLLFFVGSLPSVLPFIPSELTVHQCLFVATGATVTALLIVGAIKTWATRGNWMTAAMENLLIAGLGGVLAFAVGKVFDKILH